MKDNQFDLIIVLEVLVIAGLCLGMITFMKHRIKPFDVDSSGQPQRAGSQALATTVDEERLIKEFRDTCPLPEWWDSVTVPRLGIRNIEELLVYWRDKKRTDQQLFKVAYQAVVNHIGDDEFVTSAISMMIYVKDYEHQIPLHEFAMAHFFNYRNYLTLNSPKSGDTIGGIIRDLCGLYNVEEQFEKTVALIERFQSERGADANDCLLESIDGEYAGALYGLGRVREVKSVLNEVLAKNQCGGAKGRVREALEHYDYLARKPKLEVMDKASCEAHGGRWARIFSKEECDYPTTDAGRVCHDSVECQGICLAPENAPAGADVEGKCSSSTMKGSGCFSSVNHGKASGVICYD